jgi:hypothetical protein
MIVIEISAPRKVIPSPSRWRGKDSLAAARRLRGDCRRSH